MWIFLIVLLIVIFSLLKKKNKKDKSNKQDFKNELHQHITITNSHKDKLDISKLHYTKQLFDEFISLDFETTGLIPGEDKIIEVGAVKYKNNIQIDEYSTLINPGIHIPNNITKQTGINNKMVANSPHFKDISLKLSSFIGNLPIVAHNASFDIKFYNTGLGKCIENPIIDTLQISRHIFADLPDHKLETIKQYMGINLESHRALDDAKVAAEIYMRYCKIKKTESEELRKSFNSDELDCYNLVKNILIKNNRDLKYLRYSHTGPYFDINIVYTILRIKMKGKKQYIVSRRTIEQLKSFNPNFEYEPCTIKETGVTRIMTSDYKDLTKFEKLILENYDNAAKELNLYISGVACGQQNIDDYLLSDLK